MMTRLYNGGVGAEGSAATASDTVLF